MAEQQQRRVGCGCVPLIALFVLGSFVVGVITRVTGSEAVADTFGVAFFGFLVLVFISTVIRRARQVSQQRDAAADGSPTTTGSDPAEPPRRVVTRPEPPAPAPRPQPRVLPTPEPLEPESEALRQRMAEVVDELAGGMLEGERTEFRLRGSTSAEMIADAKERIAHWEETSETDE